MQSSKLNRAGGIFIKHPNQDPHIQHGGVDQSEKFILEFRLFVFCVNTHGCEIIFPFRQFTTVKLEAFVFICVFPAMPGRRGL